MLNCWCPDPNDRPTIAEICGKLMKMLETADESYNYVDAIKNYEIQIVVTDSDSGEVTI
jgi:hypothetical protein